MSLQTLNVAIKFHLIKQGMEHVPSDKTRWWARAFAKTKCWVYVSSYKTRCWARVLAETKCWICLILRNEVLNTLNPMKQGVLHVFFLDKTGQWSSFIWYNKVWSTFHLIKQGVEHFSSNKNKFLSTFNLIKQVVEHFSSDKTRCWALFIW